MSSPSSRRCASLHSIVFAFSVGVTGVLTSVICAACSDDCHPFKEFGLREYDREALEDGVWMSGVFNGFLVPRFRSHFVFPASCDCLGILNTTLWPLCSCTLFFVCHQTPPRHGFHVLALLLRDFGVTAVAAPCCLFLFSHSWQRVLYLHGDAVISLKGSLDAVMVEF